MSLDLEFTKQAEIDLSSIKKSGDKSTLKKINTLLLKIIENPFVGTGKPEALKYDLLNLWSRRLNREHRLIYEVVNETVIIHSLKGHYF